MQALLEALDEFTQDSANFSFQLLWLMPSNRTASSVLGFLLKRKPQKNCGFTVRAITLLKGKVQVRPGSGVPQTQLQGEAWMRHTFFFFFLSQLVKYNLHLLKLPKAWYLELHFSIIRGGNCTLFGVRKLARILFPPPPVP